MGELEECQCEAHRLREECRKKESLITLLLESNRTSDRTLEYLEHIVDLIHEQTDTVNAFAARSRREVERAEGEAIRTVEAHIARQGRIAEQLR